VPDVPHVVEIFCIADTQTACSVIPQESNVPYVAHVVEIFASGYQTACSVPSQRIQRALRALRGGRLLHRG